MLVGDFPSKSIPGHKLFEYNGGSKRVHLTKLVILCPWFDLSLVIHNINLQKHTLMKKMPRYAIFNDAYPCSMIVIQSFDINHVLWATVDIFSWAAWTETFERRCTSVRPSIRQRQSQGSFLVWAQPVRNDIILQRLLLQAESMPKMIPVYPMSFIPLLIL